MIASQLRGELFWDSRQAVTVEWFTALPQPSIPPAAEPRRLRTRPLVQAQTRLMRMWWHLSCLHALALEALGSCHSCCRSQSRAAKGGLPWTTPGSFPGGCRTAAVGQTWWLPSRQLVSPATPLMVGLSGTMHACLHAGMVLPWRSSMTWMTRSSVKCDGKAGVTFAASQVTQHPSQRSRGPCRCCACTACIISLLRRLSLAAELRCAVSMYEMHTRPCSSLYV